MSRDHREGRPPTTDRGNSDAEDDGKGEHKLVAESKRFLPMPDPLQVGRDAENYEENAEEESLKDETEEVSCGQRDHLWKGEGTSESERVLECGAGGLNSHPAEWQSHDGRQFRTQRSLR